MRRVTSLTCIVALSASLLTGCANTSMQQGGQPASCRVFGTQKQLIGALVGGAAGVGIAKAAGASNRTTALAGVGGLLAGAAIGTALDRQDCELAMAAMKQQIATAPPNAQIAWSNPQNKDSGYIEPGPQYTDPTNGRLCRHFSSTIRKSDGSATESDQPGTVCRTSGGDWEVV